MDSSYEKLQQKWYIKLKKSGFTDIEVREPETFLRNLRKYWETLSYRTSGWRVIEAYVYHCKDMPDKYKEVMQEVCQGVPVNKAVKKVGGGLKAEAVRKWMERTKPKMLEFAREFYSNDE